MASKIPLSKQKKSEIQEYLKENLSLEIFERKFGYNDTLIIRLKLGDEVIGESYAVKNEIKWYRDFGPDVDDVILRLHVKKSDEADEK